MGPSGSATVEGLKNVSGGVVGYVTFLYKHFWAVGSIFQQNVHVFIFQFSKRAIMSQCCLGVVERPIQFHVLVPSTGELANRSSESNALVHVMCQYFSKPLGGGGIV